MAQTTQQAERPANVGNVRWRLRVYARNGRTFSTADVAPDDEMLIAEERGFFTAESAARHFQTRLHAWNQVKHFVILVDQEERNGAGV